MICFLQFKIEHYVSVYIENLYINMNYKRRIISDKSADWGVQYNHHLGT